MSTIIDATSSDNLFILDYGAGAMAAAASAVAAAASATSASGSATAAASSATAASGSATAAAGSATAASGSATAAAGSASGVSGTYSNFQKYYLGAYSTAPTHDNLGGTLQTGALYFDTTAGAMKVWTGTSWQTAYNTGGGSALQAANNLSDVASASSARSNLGLGSAAVQAAPSGTLVGTSDTRIPTSSPHWRPMPPLQHPAAPPPTSRS